MRGPPVGGGAAGLWSLSSCARCCCCRVCERVRLGSSAPPRNRSGLSDDCAVLSGGKLFAICCLLGMTEPCAFWLNHALF